MGTAPTVPPAPAGKGYTGGLVNGKAGCVVTAALKLKGEDVRTYQWQVGERPEGMAPRRLQRTSVMRMRPPAGPKGALVRLLPFALSGGGGQGARLGRGRARSSSPAPEPGRPGSRP